MKAAGLKVEVAEARGTPLGRCAKGSIPLPPVVVVRRYESDCERCLAALDFVLRLPSPGENVAMQRSHNDAMDALPDGANESGHGATVMIEGGD